MKHYHAVMVGFVATFFGMVLRSAIKNYANISM